MGAKQSVPVAPGTRCDTSNDENKPRVEHDEQDKRVHTLTAMKLRWKPDKRAKIYEFVGRRSQSVVKWHLGQASVDQFAAECQDAAAKFVKGNKVTIYFQMSNTDCARRQFRSQGGFVLSVLLNCIYSTAVSAASMSVKAAKGDARATLRASDLKAYLSHRAVTGLYITSDHVYVKVHKISQRRSPRTAKSV